jgi:hypothetical protein
LVLMRILEADGAIAGVARASLSAAQRDPKTQHAWQVTTAGGPVTLKPFLDIDAENYSVYQAVLPS